MVVTAQPEQDLQRGWAEDAAAVSANISLNCGPKVERFTQEEPSLSLVGGLYTGQLLPSGLDAEL